jgi:hypothetical protein
MSAKPKARWKIHGYKGLELVFDKTLPGGYSHHGEIKTLLQRLACRDYTPDEIFNASTRTGRKQGFLEPRVDGPPNGNRVTIWIESGLVSYIAGYWRAGEPDVPAD